MSILTPVNDCPNTYRLQFPFTPPLGPRNSMAVSMRPASQSTKRMKLKTMTMPGRSCRCMINTMKMMRKMMARADMVTMYGKSLSLDRISAMFRDNSDLCGKDEPWYSEVHLLLDCYEVGKHPQAQPRGHPYDEKPEVQLSFWPVVFPPPLDGDDLCSRHSRCAKRCKEIGKQPICGSAHSALSSLFTVCSSLGVEPNLVTGQRVSNSEDFRL